MPNFNEMVSLHSMVNPERKHIKFGAKQLKFIVRRQRRRVPFSFDDKREDVILGSFIFLNYMIENEDENF